MRKILAGSVITAVAGMALAGMVQPASAATYNGTVPEYEMTGITEVKAVTESGIEIFLPVWSMDECAEEDGTGGPCVWYAPDRGTGNGKSFVQVGEGETQEFAYISNEAARVLLVPTVGTALAEQITDWNIDTATDAPVETLAPEVAELVAPVEQEIFSGEGDLTDAEMVEMGYTIQANGTATKAEEPVQAITEPCANPYGPDIKVCTEGGSEKLYSAHTGDKLEAPSFLKTVNGKPYQDMTQVKVIPCDAEWNTHCAVQRVGTDEWNFITKAGDDHIEMTGYTFKETAPGVGMFVAR